MDPLVAELCLRSVLETNAGAQARFWQMQSEIEDLMDEGLTDSYDENLLYFADIEAAVERANEEEMWVIELREVISALSAFVPRIDVRMRRAIAAINSNLCPLAEAYDPMHFLDATESAEGRDLSAWFTRDHRWGNHAHSVIELWSDIPNKVIARAEGRIIDPTNW
jgi:hypothetical protein